jgi:hypothetical protein
MFQSRLDVTSNRPGEVHASLRVILEKLSSVLTEENVVLEQGKSAEHSSFITAKNQILKELMVIHKSVDLRSLPPDLVDVMSRTRSLVDRNHALLGMQVSALQDVTDYLTRTAISEQGDGTYSRESQ